MSKKVAIAFFCLICFCGCAAGLWRSAPTAESFSRQALEFEKRGELPQALSAWRAALALDPDHPMASANIQTLENAISKAAQTHFKSAMDHYQAGDLIQARREMLTVLRLAPGHSKALYYLKTHLNGGKIQFYKVQRGDSFVKIAAEHYKDPSKAYMLAYFNDMDPGKPLLTDTVLALPVLRNEQLLSRRSGDVWVERAQRALEQKQYSEVLSICDKIRQESPGHSRVQPLIDAARFGWGSSLLEQNQPLEALEQFKQVSTAYAGRDRAIRSARLALNKRAGQEKIRSAQARLDKGAYAGAIAICRDILDKDPSNAKATALLHAARYQWGKQLLDQGDEKKAAENLRTLDPNYQDSAHLLARAHSRLNTRAEEFYRQGVKHFLNEDLESAIESWKRSLAFNPDHPKAAQDMDNALKLLEKWRGLEQSAPAEK